MPGILIGDERASGALGRSDGWGATSAYGTAHIGKSLFWYGGEVLFAYFLTEVAGLSPAAMGWVLAVGLIVSAGLDLLVGVIWRGHIATPLRAARLQLAGALAASAGLVTFLATPFVPAAWAVGWAMAGSLAFRFGFSIYDVPQNALMSLAVQGAAARARVATVRIAGSGLATLAVAGVVGPLIAMRENAAAAANLMMALGLVAIFLAVASAYGLLRAVARCGADAGGAAERATTLGGRGLAILGPYLAMMAAMMIGPPAFQKLEPYFAVEVLRSASWGGVMILASALGITVGQPLWLYLSALPRLWLFSLTAAIQAIGGLLFLALPTTQPGLLTAAAFLVGLGNGGLGVEMWAAFTDAVSGLRRSLTGLVFAGLTAMGKISLALGIGLVALVVSQARNEPQVLKLAMAIGPVAGSLAMLALAWLVTLRRSAAESTTSIDVTLQHFSAAGPDCRLISVKQPLPAEALASGEGRE